MNSSPNGIEKPNENSRVLDASAIIAVILNEPGADNVRRALAVPCHLGSVNLSEAIAKLTDRGFSPPQADLSIRDLSLTVIPFSEEHAWAAGLLRASTRHLGLSLGDRACLALAQSLGLPALTADRAWAQLDLGIEVELCR